MAMNEAAEVKGHKIIAGRYKRDCEFFSSKKREIIIIHEIENERNITWRLNGNELQ